MPRIVRAVLAASVAAGVLAPGAAGQSLLDRPPNLTGGWVGNGGQLYFNFVHRFVSSDEPERKVTNTPTFTLAAGLGMRTLLGLNYATNSALSPRYPNEWEFFARYAPLQQERGGPFDLAGQVGYNLAAEGVDGEVTVARRMGPLRLIAVGRVLSDAVDAGETRFAVGGGGTLRLTRYIALAGDVATITERVGEEKVAWSAGLQLAIPHSPHTFTLNASNTNAYTLQGTSRGEDITRYGFEFTIPITLSRYFGRGGGGGGETPAAAPGAPPAPPGVQEGGVAATGEVFRAQMQNLAFTPATIEIQAGTRVEWTNNAPLAHTVSADDGSFESGLIEPGRSWSYTFTRPGTYPFHCTPHPFMKGTVVVR